MRASTEAYALLLARTARRRFSAAWGLGESGATGLTGNRYRDAPGHSGLAVVGPAERAITRETGDADRLANRYACATAALGLLAQSLGG